MVFTITAIVFLSFSVGKILSDHQIMVTIFYIFVCNLAVDIH